ncbi:hypothetical protein [Herbaspirillum rubrisubalbicans]|uniref:LTXXQ motif family protein n=1 Tax=Herbaspirillum rubrisubalbicans TaxID=80842 RepID=A0AAD0U6M5_9BURK|nr:hypothetical protein [Herbaspirillum rubrisubalbicans]AYR22827.1 hypothetical protein RC54_02885 [Herbaspirillum rubrisubalbicans]
MPGFALPSFPKSLLCAAASALMLATALPAMATPLVDLIASDILPMTEPLKSDLNLNPNQQILWRQTEQKTRAILAQRQQRRASLQAHTDQVLHKPGGDFRELAADYDADAHAAEEEAHQLREIWFEMADALDDGQRKQVQDYILDRMQRVADGPAQDEQGHARSGGTSGSRGGMGRGMGSGAGGMGGGGGGMGGGMGGGSFSTDSGF